MKDARPGPSITVGETTIIPLERTEVHHHRFGNGVLVYASKEPLGIIVETPSGRWALDLNGQPVPLEILPVDNPLARPSSNGTTA